MTAVITPPAAPPRGRTPGRFFAAARRERPSLVVGAVVGAFLLLIAVRLPWADDLTLHLAVLRRLTASLLHPGDPVLNTGGSSTYYSPYMLALAVPGKVFGLSAYTLYKLGAVLNVLLLLFGLHRFVRTLSRARWAPPLALLGLLLWWGTGVVAWSGFLSLVSLGDTEAYPSTLATALTLHLWAWLNDRRGRTLSSHRRMAGIGALLGLILLIHQFTGMNALIGCAAILVSRHAQLRTKAAARSLAAGFLVCAAVVAAWPYYHLWNVKQSDLDVLDPVHRPLYQHVAARYALGLAAGLVALASRWRRDRTDVLVLLFLGSCTIVAYGWLTGHWSCGRSWPTALLAGQIAVAVVAAEARPGRERRAWAVPVAALTAVGLTAQSGAFVFPLPTGWRTVANRVLDHNPLGPRQGLEDLPRLDWLDAFLRPTDVVAADELDTQFEVSAHGAYDVTSPWYLPEIPAAAWKARDAAVRTIFAADTAPAERTALLHAYRVDWLLLRSGQHVPSGVGARFAAQGGGFVLYLVTG